MNDSEKSALEKIKTLRNQKGLSQAKMAELIGISQTGYAKIESTVTENIALSVAVSMAKALNVGFNELFDIDGDSQKIEKLEKKIEKLEKENKTHENNILLYEILFKNFKQMVLEKSDYVTEYFISDLNKGLAPFDDTQRKIITLMFHAQNKFFQNQLLKYNFISQDDIKAFYATKNFGDLISNAECEV